MLTQNVLQEVITLPEASVLAAGMGHGLDRSNLLRYARGSSRARAVEPGSLHALRLRC